VKKLVVGLALAVAPATLALLTAAYLEPGHRGVELDVYLLVVGAMAVLTAVLAVRRAFPVSAGSLLAEALEADPLEPVRPLDLERTERVLTMATSTAFDLHFRLRPILREIAEQRLGDRRSLTLDSGGPRVEAALGEEVWELVRPDRVQPRHRFEPGIEPAALRRVVERLESL
jgi:hypothetical protein